MDPWELFAALLSAQLGEHNDFDTVVLPSWHMEISRWPWKSDVPWLHTARGMAFSCHFLSSKELANMSLIWNF